MEDDDITSVPGLRLPGPVIMALRREALGALTAAARAVTGPLERLARSGAIKPRAASRRAVTGTRAGGQVAVIPLTGLLTARGSFFSILFGGGSGGLMGFRDAFREALNNPDVGSIVLDVDSPGGYIDLVPETAQEIYDARGTKPVIAVANTLAASGAYWIAAQADEIVVTPSGDVGSIGVYMLHEDWSGWNEQAGIAPTYISAGKFKVDGNADEPLSDTARADWQQQVDDLHALFVADVARGRGVPEATVLADYGEGRVLMADRALAAGMVDRIATIETVIGGLLQPGSSSAAAARAGRLAAVIAIRAEDTAGGAGDEEEQARCTCGRYISDGQTQCEDCKSKTEAEAKADADEDADDEPDDDAASLDAEARAGIAELLI